MDEEEKAKIPLLTYEQYGMIQGRLESAHIPFQLELMFQIEERLNEGWVAIARCERDDGGYMLTSYLLMRERW